MKLTEIKNKINNYFKKTNSANKVRAGEEIKVALTSFEDKDLSKWELKFKHGSVVVNKYGKKLFFKLG